MRVLRGIFICFGSLSILVISLVCFAADDDILNFIPAIVRAQTIPTGTWSGTGHGSWGSSCTCTLGGISFTVTTGNDNTYFVSAQTTGSATCNGSCGMSFSFANMPAAVIGNRLVFRNSFNSTMSSDLMTDLYGEILISGSSAQYFISTSNFAVPYTQSGGAMTSIVSGNLAKQ